MTRRELLGAGVVAAMMAGGAAPGPPRFSGDTVPKLARDLAARPYVGPEKTLPPSLAALDYDGYRQIRFVESRALWRDLNLPFQAHFFHRGGLAKTRVEIFEVAGGRAAPIGYTPEMFAFGQGAPDGLEGHPELGFAGFRLLNPINRPDKLDEVAAFIGASYFRGVARGGVYGLSARGLAIGAGDWPEEFPDFRAWWLERPEPGAASLVLHGLLDSPSLTGAYRFVVTPGDVTTMDVWAVLFPRKDTPRVGFAPLTSMFLFDQETGAKYDDFRPAVHDSDGIAVTQADGTRTWRPLANPPATRPTLLGGSGSFGLIQRKTAFRDYEDLEARYDLRPSLWVEPMVAWPAGQARLVELHAKSEADDNTVAEWRAAAPLKAQQPVTVAYRLNWGRDVTDPAVARVMAWRSGAGDTAEWKRLVIDFGPVAGDPEGLVGAIDVPGGEVRHVVVQPNAVTGGVRLAFNFKPGRDDIRCALTRDGRAVSETWVYPWLP